MTCQRACLANCFLLLSCAVALPGASLGGKVVEDHSGAPLASVDVSLSKTGQQRLAADLDTDASGHFSVPGLAPGEYELTLSKPNFISVRLKLQVEGEAAVIHQFRLIRGGSISGQAVDAQGRPITSGFVYAMAKPAAGDSFSPLAQSANGPVAMAPLDSSGHYRLYNLPPDQYAVALAWGATRQRAAQSGSSSALPGLGTGVQFYPSNAAPTLFPIGGGENLRANFLINAGAAYTVSGKLERELKPNDRYWLALVPPEQPGLAIASAQTDSKGVFKFEGISPGTYDLLASGPSRGYGGGGGILDDAPLFARMKVTVAGENVANISITPAEPRTVSFVLKRTDNACPDVAYLTLVSMEDWTVVLNATQAIGLKPKAVEQLAPAMYRATVKAVNDVCFGVPRIVAADEAGPVEITLSPAGSIHGMLSGSADTTQFLAVLADPAAPGDPVRVAHPGADGSFEFQGLRPGTYRIGAVATTEAARTRWTAETVNTAVTVKAGEALAVHLTAASGAN